MKTEVTTHIKLKLLNPCPTIHWTEFSYLFFLKNGHFRQDNYLHVTGLKLWTWKGYMELEILYIMS